MNRHNCQNFIILIILTLTGLQSVQVQQIQNIQQPDELLKNTSSNVEIETTTPIVLKETASNETRAFNQTTVSTVHQTSSTTSTTNAPSSTTNAPSSTTLRPPSNSTASPKTTPHTNDADKKSVPPNEKKKKEPEPRPAKCAFFKVHNVSQLIVEPDDFNATECFPSQHLILSKKQNNELNLYKDEGNILKVNIKSNSLNSFELRLIWTKLNSTIDRSANSYGILLTIYENLESIGKVFIIDKLMVNETKEIKFENLTNLNNVTYSVALSRPKYFQDLSKFIQKSNQQDLFSFDSKEPEFYLIQDVYETYKLSQQKLESLDSTSQILIYTISSFLLIVIVIGLLYYRRDKFRSLINNRFDNTPRHQNSKYVRKPNNPIINVSSHTNNSPSESPFQHHFLKNTAQFRNDDRSNGFNHLDHSREGREKRSLSTMTIGRVIEQSVATIKKRTSLKPMIPTNTVEFDLRKIDTKYSHTIPLIEFLPLLNELNKPNSQKMYNEFMQLDILTGMDTMKKNRHKVARFSKNLQKNKDGACIMPFDHTRVVLEMNRFLLSDYINASYIRGANSIKEYIACQCPMKSTAYAFWLMCIQQKVKYIVMTTQLIDSFTSMEKYWPDYVVEDGESFKQIENITIRLLDKRKFNNHTVRNFELKMNDECRLIKHYQLTEWNEFDNSQNISILIEFLKVFRDEIGFNEQNANGNWSESQASPIVVHCSNGIGRTAVFIAVDRIFVQLKRGKNAHIDIFGTVIEMRQCRSSMIQNEAQYKFIYECVGQLVRQMYPALVKQMEFDRTLDDINLNDFDANNNLDSSNNSQMFLFKNLNNSNNSNSKLPPAIKLNGYMNETFVSHDEKV